MEKQREYKINDLKKHRSPDFRTAYCNVAAVGESFYDLTITFGTVNPGEEKEEPTVEEHTSVTMSWEHAKALLKILSERIDKYESSSGAIRQHKTPSKAE